MTDTDIAIDANAQADLVERLTRVLNESYIFPDVAAQMGEALHRRLSNHEYDKLTSGAALAEAFTAHLQEVSHDKHLRVQFSPEPHPAREAEGPSPEEQDAFRQYGQLFNFGFQKVERLAGNIGYLELRSFFPAEIPGAGEAAAAAMTFLANTSALIIDLRRNTGGAPSMVALLSSYLFPEPVHLNSLYWRSTDSTHQFWTYAFVPGTRYNDKPVYILTSTQTFSGAEEFTYNLKNLKRATIVGETTGGGAHPGGTISLTDHFEVWVPTGRAISPITATNWEGIGITPDIPVSQDQALNVATIAALKAIIAQAGDTPGRPLRELLDEARPALAELEQQSVV